VTVQPVWASFKELEDPELCKLAEGPSTIAHNRAGSTVKKYQGAFRRWKTWAGQHSLPAMPAKEQHLALYLQYLGDTVGSKSAVEEAVNALAWAHSAAGLVSPVTTFVKATLEGLQRKLAKPVRKKAQ